MPTFFFPLKPNARGEPRQQPERGTSGGCWRRLQCLVRRATGNRSPLGLPMPHGIEAWGTIILLRPHSPPENRSVPFLLSLARARTLPDRQTEARKGAYTAGTKVWKDFWVSATKRCRKKSASTGISSRRSHKRQENKSVPFFLCYPPYPRESRSTGRSLIAHQYVSNLYQL